LSQAYEVLSDPEKREIYDQYGEDALKDGMGGGSSSDFHSPFDIFEQLFPGSGTFGGNQNTLCCFSASFSIKKDWNAYMGLFLTGGGSRVRRQKRGEDVVRTMMVSLEDLYNGTTKKLSLSRSVLCSKCKG
jgi:DnaJ family protein A protein 2